MSHIASEVRNSIDQTIGIEVSDQAPMRDHWGLIAATIIVLLLFPCLVWILSANYVWPWDQAYYAELSLKIHHAGARGAAAWVHAIFTVPDSRAPLLVWLGQFAAALASATGSLERALLLVNVAACGITLWLVFATARHLGANMITALAGVLACAGAVSFVVFGHQFLVETVQTMTIAGMAWMAVQADRLPFVRLLSGLVAWVALAMLAKTTSLGYVLPFLAYSAIVRAVLWRRSTSRSNLGDYALAAAATLIAAATVWWYVINWTGTMAHVAEATNRDTALLYGSTNPLLTKLLFWSKVLLDSLSVFPLFAGLVLLACFVGLLRFAARQVAYPLANRLQGIVESGFLFALCLAGTVVAALLAYSKMIEEDPRLLSPLIPIVALLFSWSLSTWRWAWLSGCVVVVLLANWLIVQLAVFGLVGVPPGSVMSEWRPAPPPVDPQAIARLTRAVHESCDRSGPSGLSVIGTELPDFSAVSAWLYAEKMRGELGYSCNYTSLGYAASDTNHAIKQLLDSNADYFVTLPLSKLPAPDADAFNRVVRPVAQWITTSPDFERTTPEGDELVIYKRRRQ